MGAPALERGAAWKTCSRCGTSFACGPGEQAATCWCEELPAIDPLAENLDCMCRDCLGAETAKQRRDSKPLLEGEDYYHEGAAIVFTALYHKRRGYCCGNGCRHCPYK